jgi:oxygen-dependent protoporphyrinogen oxidase
MADPFSQSGSQTPSTEAIRIAIVGSGITGLAAAHRLLELRHEQSRPISVTIFEAANRPGGLFGSERIGDYLVERGADSFITNKPAAIELCRRLGLEDRCISTNSRYRRSLILYRGRPVPTPEGFQLLAPGQLWPAITTPLLSWSGKARLAAEIFIPRRKETSDESLADFTRRRLGAEVLDRIVQPLVGGIYTSNPERLSLQATLPRFVEMERKYGSLIRGLRKSAARHAKDAASGARYGLFVSLRNGMQELIDRLWEQIASTAKVRQGIAIQKISRNPAGSAAGWSLTTANGSIEEFSGVILALPAQSSARLLTGVHAGSAAALQQFESASSAIVLTGHALTDIEHPLDAFGLVIPHCERRRILATSFLSRKFEGRAPEGKVVLRTFVGGAMQPEEYEQSDESMTATVLEELRKLLGVHGIPDFAIVARYPSGMPQYTVGHLDRVAEVRRQVALLPGLQLAGNYLEGVGIPDSVASGEHAAVELLKTLTSRPLTLPQSE